MTDTKTTERKIIFECRTGSYLYGTNTPASDQDFKGVFLPSKQDLLGIEQCPGEWDASIKLSDGPRNTVGDIDRKVFSIKKFIDLASQGQPGQIEMLFAPASMIKTITPEWSRIVDHHDLFVSKTSIEPFIAFAASQSQKASIKGENLVLIREIITFIKNAITNNSRIVLSNLLVDVDTLTESAKLGHSTVKFCVNEHGAKLIEIAGRQFDSGILCRSLLKSLLSMESRYGTRSESAATKGYDYKSLSHAARLISETEELLTHGTITFPRPDAAFILRVKRGEDNRDWFSFLAGEIERLEQLVQKADLPEQSDRLALNKLCIDVLFDHLWKD